MNIPEQSVLLDNLRKVQRTLCAYDLYPAVPPNALPPGSCDCKYGATRVAEHTEQGNGCPEVAAAIAVLEALLPTEWELVQTRLRDAAGVRWQSWKGVR